MSHFLLFFISNAQNISAILKSIESLIRVIEAILLHYILLYIVYNCMYENFADKSSKHQAVH